SSPCICKPPPGEGLILLPNHKSRKKEPINKPQQRMFSSPNYDLGKGISLQIKAGLKLDTYLDAKDGNRYEPYSIKPVARFRKADSPTESSQACLERGLRLTSPKATSHHFFIFALFASAIQWTIRSEARIVTRLSNYRSGSPLGT